VSTVGVIVHNVSTVLVSNADSVSIVSIASNFGIFESKVSIVNYVSPIC